MYKALIFRPGRPAALETLNGYEQTRAALGGYLEFVSAGGGPSGGFYCDEDGKAKDLAVNVAATRFFQKTCPIGLHPGDVLVGTVIVFGVDPDVIDERDVPDWLVEKVRASGVEMKGGA